MSNRLDIYASRSISKIHSDWSVMNAQSIKLKDDHFRNDALSYARQIMRRAKGVILEIIDSLTAQNYRFAYKDRCYKGPEVGIEEILKTYQEKGVFVPISLHAWMVEVGVVNLMGTHPDWDFTAYVFDGNKDTLDIKYTDPLVIDVESSFIDYIYKEWIECRYNVGEPFAIQICPDHITKANVSGGMPYDILVSEPQIDPIVRYSRKIESFVQHIRNALLWKGFPGLEYYTKEMLL